MTPRSFTSSARIASSSAIVCASSSYSSRSFWRSSAARRRSAMSRMCVACVSLNSYGASCSAVRAASADSEPRINVMIASIMSSAFSRPSRMCARSRALFSRYWLRRVMTSTWCADVHLERLAQVEHARHTVDERDLVRGEVRLHRRVLVELVQHHLRVRVALEVDDETDGVARRQVGDVADALDAAIVDELVDLRRRSTRPTSGTATRTRGSAGRPWRLLRSPRWRACGSSRGPCGSTRRCRPARGSTRRSGSRDP